MYKVASDRRQVSLHRGRPTDWVNGQETLKFEDQVRQLQDGINILNDRIQAMPKGAERRALGQEKFQMQIKLAELKKQAKRDVPLSWKSFFVNEAKRILSDSQFQLIYKSAIRECKLASERLDRPTDLSSLSAPKPEHTDAH